MPAKPKTIDDYLARVSAHVQENVAFPRLVSAVNRAGCRCRLANMFCRFHGRVIGALCNAGWSWGCI